MRLYDGTKEVLPAEYCPIFNDGFEGISFSKQNLKLISYQNKEAFANASTGHIKEARRVGIRCMLVLHDITKERIVEKMKREFVSIAAHQLRTPLSGLRWLVIMLLKGDLGKLNVRQKKFLKQGRDNADYMTRMIDELLDVSRMEEGRYHYEPEKINVVSVLKEVVEEHQIKIDAKALTLNMEETKVLPDIFIDPATFRISFQNVLENAVRYTGSGGKIDVSAREEGGKVVVVVKDNGIGIPEEEKEQIFTKFFRGKKAIQMETEGNGIGLYVVRSILESQGGNVRFESKEGEGTAVYLSLPVFKENK
ncbi:MAG: hypothetical protein A2835_03005 [Candidatus Niyogibacteria bacterium RIFCSPHIGHO2_01_FULL_45_28]|nr:MAG: hypothetical protein A2835_03005 [Candidatus Niyogibacteria bacterium RIFCSPHIGHO2_01_FULL_45_28]